MSGARRGVEATEITRTNGPVALTGTNIVGTNTNGHYPVTGTNGATD